MINALAGELDAGCQILGFKVGQLFQNLRPGKARCEQIEHIDHANSQAPDAGPSPAKLRINGDAVGQLHWESLPDATWHCNYLSRIALDNFATRGILKR